MKRPWEFGSISYGELWSVEWSLQENIYIIKTTGTVLKKLVGMRVLQRDWNRRNRQSKEQTLQTAVERKVSNRGGMAKRSQEGTSAGVCSARRRLPSKRKAMDWGSTDWRSQYACISFFSVAVLLILKNTSPPSCTSATLQPSLGSPPHAESRQSKILLKHKMWSPTFRHHSLALLQIDYSLWSTPCLILRRELLPHQKRMK